MQVLAHNPEIQSYSNEDGHFITGFLIGTKLNDAQWAINKEKGHEYIQKFIGKDFAIIPELIQKPLSQGGGGHYWGKDTREDLAKGYAEHSHGKITRVKGPYSYNDGSDDYYYNFDIKLRDSKAASALVHHGSNVFPPFSVSPHIWPLEGPDHNYTKWDPVGVALVIKGAFGPQAVVSKLCKGTAVQCEKSMGASICEKADQESAEIISSIVSKSASSQISMPESKGEATTTPQVTTLVADVVKPNATVNAQEAITNSAILTKVVTPEQFAESEKARAELEKQVTELRTKDKLNTLNNMFAKVKDEKAKEELIKKYSKADNVDQLKEFITEVYPILRASEEEEKPAEDDKPEDDKDLKKAKSKGASLPKEPVIPKEETSESKAASVPVNKLQEILRFQMSGGRA